MGLLKHLVSGLGSAVGWTLSSGWKSDKQDIVEAMHKDQRFRLHVHALQVTNLLDVISQQIGDPPLLLLAMPYSVMRDVLTNMKLTLTPEDEENLGRTEYVIRMTRLANILLTHVFVIENNRHLHHYSEGELWTLYSMQGQMVHFKKEYGVIYARVPYEDEKEGGLKVDAMNWIRLDHAGKRRGFLLNMSGYAPIFGALIPRKDTFRAVDENGNSMLDASAAGPRQFSDSEDGDENDDNNIDDDDDDYYNILEQQRLQQNESSFLRDKEQRKKEWEEMVDKMEDKPANPPPLEKHVRVWTKDDNTGEITENAIDLHNFRKQMHTESLMSTVRKINPCFAKALEFFRLHLVDDEMAYGTEENKYYTLLVPCEENAGDPHLWNGTSARDLARYWIRTDEPWINTEREDAFHIAGDQVGVMQKILLEDSDQKSDTSNMYLLMRRHGQDNTEDWMDNYELGIEIMGEGFSIDYGLNITPRVAIWVLYDGPLHSIDSL